MFLMWGLVIKSVELNPCFLFDYRNFTLCVKFIFTHTCIDVSCMCAHSPRAFSLPQTHIFLHSVIPFIRQLLNVLTNLVVRCARNRQRLVACCKAASSCFTIYRHSTYLSLHVICTFTAGSRWLC